MKTQTNLPRGVHAIADVLTMILTDLPPGCLPDREPDSQARRTDDDRVTLCGSWESMRGKEEGF